MARGFGPVKRNPGLIYVLAALVVFGVVLARFFGYTPWAAAPPTDDPSAQMQNGIAASDDDTAPRIPSVVVYHTHTTENYKDNPTHATRGPGDVVQVGERFVATLRQNNVGATHVMTVHDLPDWDGAVDRAVESVLDAINRVSNVGVIVDIHRDAIPPGEPPGYAQTSRDGVTYARMLFIVGTADNPLAQHNLRFAEKVRDRLEEAVPRVTRGVRLMQQNTNGHLVENSLTVFIGDYGENTVEEAMASAELLGQVLASMLHETDDEEQGNDM